MKRGSPGAFTITLDRDPLLKALSRILGVAARRGTIPILNNVRIEAGADAATFTGTDLDRQATIHVPGRGEGSGAITVPASQLGDIVRATVAGGEVILDYEPSSEPRLVVRCGRSRFKLPVLPASDFPHMAEDGLPEPVEIPCTDLRTLIDKVAFAMSNDQARAFLNGVYLSLVEIDGETRLRAVATDRHRLAVSEVPAPQGMALDKGRIIPASTIKELPRLLDGEQTARLSIGEHLVRIDAGAASLVSKLIDGNYPPYERVIPRDNPHQATISVGALVSAVARTQAITTDRTRAVKLGFSPGLLSLQSRNMEAGEASDEFEIDYDGPPIEIVFQGQYLTDTATHVGADKFVIALAGAVSSALVTVDGDDTQCFVLLPLRA